MAYNVFLSFSMEDKKLVNLFRGQVQNERLPLNFRDHSIKEQFDRAWKTHCENKIRRCSRTVCLIGYKTYLSEAVDWELRKSVELGKGIIAVYLVDGNPPLPKVLREKGVRAVRWEMEEIMREIRNASR
ncbi:MAG: TIR domain-containing protein [bacterium]|nr:TIR domain-containing protein [bacterium]